MLAAIGPPYKLPRSCTQARSCTLQGFPRSCTEARPHIPTLIHGRSESRSPQSPPPPPAHPSQFAAGIAGRLTESSLLSHMVKEVFLQCQRCGYLTTQHDTTQHDSTRYIVIGIVIVVDYN